MTTTYRVTVAGPLPGSLAGVIRSRFAGVAIRAGARTAPHSSSTPSTSPRCGPC